MKTALLFNFEVDKTNKKINVNREFDAPRDLVWDAWTKSEILDQWWAPKPWKSKTKHHDFRDGGYWIYAMVGPEGEEHWARADYSKIHPKDSFSVHDAFSDSEGNINKDMPQNNWDINFKPKAETTLVEIELSFDKLEDLEKIIEMGFKEGFTIGLDQLDALFKNLKAGTNSAN